MDYSSLLVEYYTEGQVTEKLNEMIQDVCRIERDFPNHKSTERLYQDLLVLKRLVLKIKKER